MASIYLFVYYSLIIDSLRLCVSMASFQILREEEEEKDLTPTTRCERPGARAHSFPKVARARLFRESLAAISLGVNTSCPAIFTKRSAKKRKRDGDASRAKMDRNVHGRSFFLFSHPDSGGAGISISLPRNPEEIPGIKAH